MAFYELNSLSHKKKAHYSYAGRSRSYKILFSKKQILCFWRLKRVRLNKIILSKMHLHMYISIQRMKGKISNVTGGAELVFFFSLHFLECMNTSIAVSRGIPGDPSVHRGGPAPARIRMKETCFISVYDSGAAASNGH